MMTEPAPPPGGLSLKAVLAALPPDWPHDPLPEIQAARRAMGQALVVLDDDPTGTQSVHGLPVLTEWPPDALYRELAHPAPSNCFYLLTNSRSLPIAEAQGLNHEIGRSLREAARLARRGFAVISRSDSTLRGHFPGETDALSAALGGGFHATLVIPAFLAGGRYTINDTHYIAEADRLLPASETEFARDAAFGYSNSNLRHWVAEKSGGRIPAELVASLSLDEIRRSGPHGVTQRLLSLPPGSVCVVNAASERDLAVAALAALQAEAAGPRFMYRTAASFVRLRAGLSERPLLETDELNLPATGGGLIVAGSHVPKTTAQIEALQATGLRSIEISAAALLAGAAGNADISRASAALDDALKAGLDVLLYTSRGLITGAHSQASLDIGSRISAGLIEIVRSVRTRPRYLLAKGGITSSDIATRVLGVRRAVVLGQLIPGVPVWQLGEESRWPDLAYIVFPGNVGQASSLAEIVQRLKADGVE